MESDKILVVMPCINLWDRYSKQCLDSLVKSILNVQLEILLIDNGSNDGTEQKYQEYISKFATDKQSEFHYIKNENNIGCGAGWNQGVKFGLENGFTHFLIINNDILVSPNTIKALYERIQTIGTEPNTNKMLIGAVDVSGECHVPESVLDITAGINRKDPSESPHPNFSCFMITKNTIDKIGYFDEQFQPAYFEDNSYHYRCKLLAGNDSAITITQGAFYHFGSRTQNEAYSGSPVVPGNLFVANRQRFVKLWGGEPSKETFTHPYNDQTLSAKLNADQQYEKLV